MPTTDQPERHPDDFKAMGELARAACEYYDAFIAPVYLKDVPPEVVADLRGSYAEDILGSGIAAWQIAKWWLLERNQNADR